MRRIPSVLVGIALLLVFGGRSAVALTIDARADFGAAATRASGRVLSAVSERGPGGVLVTRVVLGDAAGREVTRFVVPGGREGGVQWVAEGMPAFVVGEQVEVALSPSPLGPTVLELPGGPAAVRRLAPAPNGASGGAFAPAGVSSVTELLPSIGGAVPDDPTLVTVMGTGFGATQADSRVTFQGIFERVDAAVVSWSDQQIVCRVPAPGLRGVPQVLSGPVKVWTQSGGWSDGDQFNGGARFSVLYQWAGDSWPTARLPIAVWVNPGHSSYGGGLGDIVAAAAAQWNVPGAYARLEYRGLTAAVGGSHNDPNTPRDGRNTVIWRDVWPYQDAILAITWSAIDTLTFERQEVEMEINGGRAWTLDTEADPTAFDLPSTLTHEFGHWLRLGHTQQVPSVMVGFISAGERRREISVGDGFGASWIHPSYGTAAVPEAIPSGNALIAAVRAFDRQGIPRAGLFRGVIEVRAIALAASAPTPAALDSPLTVLPTVDVNADADTDPDGATTATLAGLPDGLYRIETFVENRFVRPASIVRVGPPPVPVAPPLALAGVTPSPLTPGTRGVIRFSLPSAADVQLDLYDARGRRVRAVAAARYAAGQHSIALETMGADGRELSSGVYFLRLAGASFAPQTARVVVLR